MPKASPKPNKAGGSKKKRTLEDEAALAALPVEWPLPSNPATLELLSVLLKPQKLNMKTYPMYIPAHAGENEFDTEKQVLNQSLTEPSPFRSVERTSPQPPMHQALTMPRLIARVQMLLPSQYECRNCIEDAETLLRHSCLIYQSKLLITLFDQLIVKQLASHIRYYDAMSERTLTLLVELLVQVLRECFELAVSEQTSRESLCSALNAHLNKVGTREYAPPEEPRPPPLPTPPPSSKGKKNAKKKEKLATDKEKTPASKGKKAKKEPDPLKKQNAPSADVRNSAAGRCSDGTPESPTSPCTAALPTHGPAKLPLLSAQDLELVCRFFNHAARERVIQHSLEYFDKSYSIHKLCLCYSRQQERSFSSTYMVPTVTQRRRTNEKTNATTQNAPDSYEPPRVNSLPPLQLASNCYLIKYGYDCQQLVRRYFERVRELERRMPYDMQLESLFNLGISEAIKSTNKHKSGDSCLTTAKNDFSVTLPIESETARDVVVEQTRRIIEQEWFNIKHMLWRNQLDVEFIGSIANVKVPLKSVPQYVSYVNFDMLNVDELGRLTLKIALNSEKKP